MAWVGLLDIRAWSSSETAPARPLHGSTAAWEPPRPHSRCCWSGEETSGLVGRPVGMNPGMRRLPSPFISCAYARSGKWGGCGPDFRVGGDCGDPAERIEIAGTGDGPGHGCGISPLGLLPVSSWPFTLRSSGNPRPPRNGNNHEETARAIAAAALLPTSHRRHRRSSPMPQTAIRTARNKTLTGWSILDNGTVDVVGTGGSGYLCAAGGGMHRPRRFVRQCGHPQPQPFAHRRHDLHGVFRYRRQPARWQRKPAGELRHGDASLDPLASGLPGRRIR